MSSIKIKNSLTLAEYDVLLADTPIPAEYVLPDVITGQRTFSDGVILVDTVTATHYKLIIQDGVLAVEEL